jgi:hypothetical protein
MQIVHLLIVVLCLGVLGGCYVVPPPYAYGGYSPQEGSYQGDSGAYDRGTAEDEQRADTVGEPTSKF